MSGIFLLIIWDLYGGVVLNCITIFCVKEFLLEPITFTIRFLNKHVFGLKVADVLFKRPDEPKTTMDKIKDAFV